MAKPKFINPYIWGTGRRKTSVARVRLKAGGSGKIIVNKKPVAQYFGTECERRVVLAPLEAVGETKNYDVFVNTHGGGYSGQAGAIAMGLARALLTAKSEHEEVLREGGGGVRQQRARHRRMRGRAVSTRLALRARLRHQLRRVGPRGAVSPRGPGAAAGSHRGDR